MVLLQILRCVVNRGIVHNNNAVVSVVGCVLADQGKKIFEKRAAVVAQEHNGYFGRRVMGQCSKNCGQI